MRISATIDRGQLKSVTDGVKRTMAEVKGRVQNSMASAFRDCVLANFGGAERFVEQPYPPLSPAYARKVGRSYATLYVSGKLKGSIYVGIDDDDSATVSVSNNTVPYAKSHQYGTSRMPARPFFPVDEDGGILPEVEELVMLAAREEFIRLMAA